MVGGVVLVESKDLNIFFFVILTNLLSFSLCTFLQLLRFRQLHRRCPLEHKPKHEHVQCDHFEWLKHKSEINKNNLYFRLTIQLTSHNRFVCCFMNSQKDSRARADPKRVLARHQRGNLHTSVFVLFDDVIASGQHFGHLFRKIDLVNQFETESDNM